MCLSRSIKMDTPMWLSVVTLILRRCDIGDFEQQCVTKLSRFATVLVLSYIPKRNLDSLASFPPFKRREIREIGR